MLRGTSNNRQQEFFSLLKSGKVLSSRQPAWFLLCNPETSSRVTLALLGIAFQANLAYSCNSLDSCSLSPLTCLFLNTNDSNITNSVRSKISVLNSLRGSFAHAQNLSRIALMRRILSFTDFLSCFWIWYWFSCACTALDSSSWGKSVKIHAPDRRIQSETTKLRSVKEQIRRICAIRDSFWTLVVVAKRWAHEIWLVLVLSSRQPFIMRL